MKNFLLFLPAFFFAHEIFSQTIVPGGVVTGPWTAAGSPYIVQGNIQCNNLVIQAGVDVRFQNGSGLTSYNSVKAQGTTLLPVIFESDDTTGWSNMSIANGGTSGIYIYGSTSDTSIFDHCIIRDAKGLISNNAAVCLGVYGSHLVLTNSEIYHNYISGTSYIISVSNVPPVITDNSIHNNYGRGCGGISIWSTSGIISGNELYQNSGNEGGAFFIVSDPDPAGPTITNNNIHNNRAYFDGGAIMIEDGPVTISNNTIAFNHSARAGAGIYVLYAHAKILSNWICNNTDSIYNNCGINDGGGGILINNGSGADTAEVYNNVIANNNCCFEGGGIRVCGGAGTAFIENNDIVNNTCHGGYFTGGINISNNIYASIRNNILYGNRGFTTFGQMDSVQIYAGANDTIAIEYNCAEFSYMGGLLTNSGTQVTGNQSTNTGVYGVDPGFVMISGGAGILYDGTAADWHLVSTSVCIDSGTTVFLAGIPMATDLYGDPRILGIAIDKGAVEYPSETGMVEQNKNTLEIFPNPSSDLIYIKDLSPFTDVRIANAAGQIVSAEKYRSGIDLSAFVPGVYFVSFTDKNGRQTTSSFVKQ
ncbi:MAG: right-handed parallel beta-helix repeat-containing protein [Bacteroidetes bacterium]|nr:right-handed parallel beta-helix repeat-containing protein [Bacteroidota bacterium]